MHLLTCRHIQPCMINSYSASIPLSASSTFAYEDNFHLLPMSALSLYPLCETLHSRFGKTCSLRVGQAACVKSSAHRAANADASPKLKADAGKTDAYCVLWGYGSPLALNERVQVKEQSVCGCFSAKAMVTIGGRHFREK